MCGHFVNLLGFSLFYYYQALEKIMGENECRSTDCTTTKGFLMCDGVSVDGGGGRGEEVSRAFFLEKESEAVTWY